MDHPDCSCEVCAYVRRAETRRLLGQPGAGDVAAVAVAVLLPVLAILGVVVAWLVGR